MFRYGLRVTRTLSSFRGAILIRVYPATLIKQEVRLDRIESFAHVRQIHAQRNEQEHRISTVYNSLPSSSGHRPQIRLLELDPGHGNHPVTTQLHETELTNDLDYEAVSYCWGDAKDVECITCNGQQLFVPRRLEVALRSIRYHGQPRMLWADAICINQSDVAEKESQVQLMRTIFSNAKRTLIYLGDEHEKQAQSMSKFAIWSIKFGLSIFRRRVDLLTSPQIPVWNMEERKYRILTPFSSHFYLELIGMLRMPWFQRAWVVQEVAVSSKATIFWGASQYAWEDVLHALKFMSQVNFPLTFIVTLENISAIEEERILYRKSNKNLNGVLLRHQRCMATDPRDKIYSFSGLVETRFEHSRPVRISYEDDVSVIYREVALNIINDTQSLDILSRAPTPATSTIKNLPSWVPDWSVSSSTTLNPNAWGHGPLSLAGTELSNPGETRRFLASGKSKYAPEMSGSALVVEGYEIDKVAKAGPVFHGVQVPYNVQSLLGIVQEWAHCFQTLWQARKVFIGWQKVANVRSKNLYLTGETMRDAFLQTISAAEVHDSDRIKLELELWEKGTRFPFGLLHSVWKLSSHFMMNKPFLLFEIQGRYALKRRIVRTEKGHLGLVSYVVEAGDSVMICKGSSVPLIMRQSEGDDDFSLVGDAYVHGIMRGEAYQEHKCQRIILK